MKVKLDRFYISTPIKNRYNFKYDKKNKIRPSWIQIKNAPKGTHWVKILKNGEAFWYRIYFKDYYFPIKYDFKDYENYYDEIADKYESFVPQNKKIGERVLSLLKKYKISKDVEILELCAGTGIISEIIAKAGYEKIHLVDISEKELKIARKRKGLKSCKFTKADISNFNPKKEYKVIIDSMGFDYFAEGDMNRIFKMISRSLSKNGIFININLHIHPEYNYYLKKLEGNAFTLKTQDAGLYRYEYFVGRKK